MHSFSIDSAERRVVPFLLAAVALGVTALVHKISLLFDVSLPAAVLTPSAFAVYGLLYAGFERYFWRWKLVRKICSVKTPIVDGEWKATLSSSLDDFETEFFGTVSIAQTWTRLHAYFSGSDAFSQSEMAAFRFIGPTRISLVWVYQSEKRPEFATSEYLHFGTCRFIGPLDASGVASELEGSYFTDKSRNSYGRMKLEWIP